MRVNHLKPAKFGLRTMESLRKIAAGSCAALVLTSGAYLAAHAAQRPPRPAPAQAAGQQSGPPLNDAQARITVNSNLVVLPVTVKDRSGEMVPDLTREDFRVFEDNVEQKIDVFSAEAFPLSM